MKFLKKIFKDGDPSDIKTAYTIQRLAITNAINRRKNTRVKYPHIGPVGRLPTIFFEEKALKIHDVSVGGVCVLDPLEELDLEAGQEFQLTFSWEDCSYDVVATMVRVNLDKKHVKLLNPNPDITVRLQLLLKPGYIGTKFHKVPQIPGSPVQLQALELWVGPTGESLSFIHDPDNPEVLGEMRLFKTDIEFREDSPPVYRSKGRRHEVGQRLDRELIKDIIICLANIKNPSQRVIDLIERIEPYLTEEDVAA